MNNTEKKAIPPLEIISATELVEGMKKLDENFGISSRAVAKKLSNLQGLLREKYGIKYLWERSSKGRVITLFRE